MVKDRFPQPLSFQVAGPNATDDLGNEIEFPLVLPRAETGNTRIVTEVVKVVYDLGGSLHALSADADGLRVSLSYRALLAAENDHAFPTATIGHEAVLDAIQFQINHSGTAGSAETNGAVVEHHIGAGGGGLIFPGNKLFINLSTDVDLSGHFIGVSIFYRQHLVGLTEFMGILAARQQN